MRSYYTHILIVCIWSCSKSHCFIRFGLVTLIKLISEAISMADKVIVLTNRPCQIKSIYDIKLENKSTPINNRKDKNFAYYYDLIWKDIDYHV